MSISIHDIKVSQNRKRVDAHAKFELGIFDIFDNSKEYTAQFRIMSPDPIPEGEEERLLRQIHHQRKNWQQGKQNQFVRFENKTGYIMKYTPIEEQEDTEPKDEAL